MSLFQAKEWWGLRVSADEEFDEKHLCVDNIDNASDGSQKIILGSFSGMLRIYSPIRGQYKIEHLLFESNLGQSIMQLQCGNFKRTGEVSLCVLQFKKVSFYYFQETQGIGLQSKLIKEHRLERNAFNMCVGTFGYVKSDCVCIQSCDAMLMIYEPEKFQCMCQLSTEYFPLPGAICYNSITDMFLIQNSCNDLECYKYSNIASTAQAQTKDPKRAVPNWTLNIGEQAQKFLTVFRVLMNFFANNVNDYIVITEWMLFVINQNGSIRNQKRFDYPPATIIMNQQIGQSVSENSNGQSLNSLIFTIASFTHHLMVYSDFQLIWAAKTDYICHGLTIATFQNQQGLLTLLNDEGWLQVIFLGTQLPVVYKEFQSPQDQSYQELELEYIKTLKKIAQKESNNNKLDQQIEVKLNLHPQVYDIQFDSQYIEDSQLYFKTINNQVLYVQMRITLSCSVDATNIQINVNKTNGVIVQPSQFSVDKYNVGNTPLTFLANIYACSKTQRLDSTIEIIASVQTKQNNQKNSSIHCTQAQVQLPTSLFCYLIPPTKQAEFKITLTVSQQIELHKIFSDLVQLSEQNQNQILFKETISNPNALTMKMNNGQEINGEFKVTVFWRLCSQCKKSHGGSKVFNIYIFKHPKTLEQKIQISFIDQIPLQDIFNRIEEHYSLRQSMIEYKKDLEAKATEFRTIQKKLLTRYKEKNNSSTISLELLLQSSFDSMMELIEKTQVCQNALEQQNQSVILVSQMMILLIKLRFGISNQIFDSLQILFPKYCYDQQEVFLFTIGWEDIVYGNINNFLRTFIKGGEINQNSQYAQIDDIQKLNKIITILIDKISKGNIA